jgi:hypothetical protein
MYEHAIGELSDLLDLIEEWERVVPHVPVPEALEIEFDVRATVLHDELRADQESPLARFLRGEDAEGEVATELPPQFKREPQKRARRRTVKRQPGEPA